MEDKHIKKTIWGSWWEPMRKWFYPVWLAYELSLRFIDYSYSVYQYFSSEQNCIANCLGQLGTHVLNVFCTLSMFVVCSIFLTLPACYAMFHFFKADNLTSTKWEANAKMIF